MLRHEHATSMPLMRAAAVFALLGMIFLSVRSFNRDEDGSDNAIHRKTLTSPDKPWQQAELTLPRKEAHEDHSEAEDGDNFGDQQVKNEKDRNSQNSNNGELVDSKAGPDGGEDEEKRQQPLHEQFDLQPEELDDEHDSHGQKADIDAFRASYKLILDPASEVILDGSPRLFLFHFGAGDGEAIEWLTSRVPHGKDFKIFAVEADEDAYRKKFEKRMARLAQEQTQGDHLEESLDKRLSVFWGLSAAGNNGTCARPGPGTCVDVVDFIARRVRREDYVLVIIARPREPIDTLVSSITLRNVPATQQFEQLVDELFLECELDNDPLVHADCMVMLDWMRVIGIYTHEWRSR